MKTFWWILFPFVLLATAFCDAGEATNFVARLTPIPPFPALQAAAKASGIPLKGIDRPIGTNRLSPGDSATMLVSWHKQGGWRTQWLIYFQAATNAQPSPPKPRQPTVLYTSTGNRFEFADSPAMLHVRTIGPFVEPNAGRKQSAFKDKSAMIRANKTFLALGLDGAAPVLHRMYRLEQQQKDKSGFNFGISSKTFTRAQINRGRKIAARLHITKEDERSLAGGVPALFSYFSTVQQTPELESILLKVLRMPSVWSIVKNLGISPGIQIGRPLVRLHPVSLAGWALPGRSLYALPVEVTLNQHRALMLTMIVTTPRPPLLVCGGIVGFLAEDPAHQQNYLTLRVISAHCGNGASKARQAPLPTVPSK